MIVIFERESNPDPMGARWHRRYSLTKEEYERNEESIYDRVVNK